MHLSAYVTMLQHHLLAEGAKTKPLNAYLLITVRVCVGMRHVHFFLHMLHVATLHTCMYVAVFIRHT